MELCCSLSPILGQWLACHAQPFSPTPSLSRHLLCILASPGKARVRPGGRVRTAQPSSSLLGRLGGGGGAGLLMGAWCLPGRRGDLCEHRRVSGGRAGQTLPPLRIEACSRLLLVGSGQGQRLWLCCPVPLLSEHFLPLIPCPDPPPFSESS